MGKEKESSKKPASRLGKSQRENSNAHASPDEGRALARTTAKILAAVVVGVGGVLSMTRRRSRSTNAMPEPQTPAEQPTGVPTYDIEASPTAAPQPALGFDHDAVALRAYYLSVERRAAGLPEDPRRDWLDAERELRGARSVTRLE